MLEMILVYGLIAIYAIFGLYLNFMMIRDDIRHERERKAKQETGDS